MQVQAFVRGDTIVEPVVVNFGKVEESCGAEKTIKVSHKGDKEWQITNVRSGNPHLSAEARELSRSKDEVSYEVIVRLDKDAPSGRFCEPLILVTDASTSNQLPVPVEGIVAGAIVVGPESLLIGVVQAGEKTTRQIVVQGKRAFRITGVTCEGAGLTAAAPDVSLEKPLHLVPIILVAPQEPGLVKGTVRIETSLGTGHR